jgi:hypothetical protein
MPSISRGFVRWYRVSTNAGHESSKPLAKSLNLGSTVLAERFLDLFKAGHLRGVGRGLRRQR